MVAFIVRGVRACLKKTNKNIEDARRAAGIYRFSPTSGILETIFESSNVNFRELLQTKFDIPVFVENNANLTITLAEHWFGMAKGLENAVGVTDRARHRQRPDIQWKTLPRGAVQGLAAEFGHTKLVFGGPPCQCGERGCMETILQRSPYPSGRESPIAFRTGTRLPRAIPVDPSDSAKAEAGDKSMMRIFEQMGRYLGLGISEFGEPLKSAASCDLPRSRCATLIFSRGCREVAERMVIPPLKQTLL